jgi:hypothetical protein
MCAAEKLIVTAFDSALPLGAVPVGMVVVAPAPLPAPEPDQNACAVEVGPRPSGMATADTTAASVRGKPDGRR